MRSADFVTVKNLWTRSENFLSKILGMYYKVRSSFDINRNNQPLNEFIERAERIFIQLHSLYPHEDSNFRFLHEDLVDLSQKLRDLREQSQIIYIRDHTGQIIYELRLHIRAPRCRYDRH